MDYLENPMAVCHGHTVGALVVVAAVMKTKVVQQTYLQDIQEWLFIHVQALETTVTAVVTAQ
jgi:hypothetical protein